MRLLLGALTFLLLNSCAQLTRLDTARTIGEGNSEIGAQIAAYGLNEETSPDLGAIALPFVALNFNHGITQRIDLMFSANTAGNILFNPKFQIFGDKTSTLAIALLPGIDAQFNNFDGSNETNVFFRPHLSGIISMHQDEYAIFLEPKYIYQINEKTHFVGSTIGIDYSLEKTSFGLGLSYFPILGKDSASGSSLYQLGFSVMRKLGKR